MTFEKVEIPNENDWLFSSQESRIINVLRENFKDIRLEKLYDERDECYFKIEFILGEETLFIYLDEGVMSLKRKGSHFLKRFYVTESFMDETWKIFQEIEEFQKNSDFPFTSALTGD